MAFDPMLQRQIMGRFATGVTVVTTRGADDHLCGLTANAVASLSLEPPLVLVAVDRRSHSHGCFLKNQCFAVNVLSSGQEELSRRFAKTGPKDFADLAATTAVTGAPILKGTLGYLDCRVMEVLPGGDHDIFIGEIVAGEAREGLPLMYFCGKYTRLVE
jgi:flavin reductase (DIM6/NTAB) family NADH-FMN oxidoreductase RutF